MRRDEAFLSSLNYFPSTDFALFSLLAVINRVFAITWHGSRRRSHRRRRLRCRRRRHRLCVSVVQRRDGAMGGGVDFRIKILKSNIDSG